MRFITLLLAVAIPGVATADQARSATEAERGECEGASNWAPVRLPPAGVNLAIPCDDNELGAYKNSNDTLKKTDGVVGCESGGRKFIVIYTVNTPEGFFDGFVSRSSDSRNNQFEADGHRFFRSGEVISGRVEATQLVEIDASRAILMTASSKALNDAGFSKITSCFFNSFKFMKS